MDTWTNADGKLEFETRFLDDPQQGMTILEPYVLILQGDTSIHKTLRLRVQSPHLIASGPAEARVIHFVH